MADCAGEGKWKKKALPLFPPAHGLRSGQGSLAKQAACWRCYETTEAMLHLTIDFPAIPSAAAPRQLPRTGGPSMVRPRVGA